jgi:hypothetical protein
MLPVPAGGPQPASHSDMSDGVCLCVSVSQPKDWSIRMNKKERRLALATALQSAAQVGMGGGRRGARGFISRLVCGQAAEQLSCLMFSCCRCFPCQWPPWCALGIVCW